MRFFIVAVVLSFALATAAQQIQEAPTGFDNKSNGVADDATHQADQVKFDEVEGLDDGLGPLYNAQSCRECHQNPTSGGPSQVTIRRPQIGLELDRGHQLLFGLRELPLLKKNPAQAVVQFTVVRLGR